MPNYDLSSATIGKVANQTVDMLRIANQTVWTATDGPFFLNDAAGTTPNSFSDGTPNIVTGLAHIFHNDGFVTGLQWWDRSASAGNVVFGIYQVTTSNGQTPNTGASKLATATIASTGAGFRRFNFSSPVTIDKTKVYVVTRYSATGFYVHTTAFAGHHGAFTDADPVYLPALSEDISPVIPGWTSIKRSLFSQGSGDVVPVSNGNGAFYGVTPIFYKHL